MSWYVTAVGRAAPVMEAVRRQIDGVMCSEPEQTIKGMAASLIEKALTAYPSNAPVRVTAQGSQSTSHGGAGEAINSLEIKVEPLFGFVE
jgi:hypothetical protein